jgi:hypothetical protein
MLVGNLALAGWILLGTADCAQFNVIPAVAFFVVSAFLVFYELGKKGCLSCYYCKACTIGMGKLPDLFFSNEGIKNLNRKGRQLLPYVYGLVGVVPVVVAAVAVVLEWSVLRAVLFAVLMVFLVFSAVAMKKRSLK